MVDGLKRLSIGAILAHSHPTALLFSPTHRMEDKDRGLRPGYPAWANPDPGRSSSRGDEGWKRRAEPNPRKRDKNPSSRAGSSVGGGSQRSLKKKRYQNPSESGDDSRPPDGKRREVFAGLGKTSGITSAGAWSAWLEIANLLEIGCDPDHWVKLIRKGEEADYPLAPNGELRLVWVDEKGDICKRAKRRTSSPPHDASEPDEGKSVASSVGDESEVAALASQKLSLSGALWSLPPWVDHPGGLKEGSSLSQPLVDAQRSVHHPLVLPSRPNRQGGFQRRKIKKQRASSWEMSHSGRRQYLLERTLPLWEGSLFHPQGLECSQNPWQKRKYKT